MSDTTTYFTLKVGFPEFCNIFRLWLVETKTTSLWSMKYPRNFVSNI